MSLQSKLLFLTLFIFLAILGGIGASAFLQFMKGPPPPSVAEATLADVWADKLGTACEPPDMNDVRWCTAYVEIKEEDSTLKGAISRVVHVSAIYADGTARVQRSRAEGLYRTVIDPRTVVSSDQDFATMAERFRKQK